MVGLRERRKIPLRIGSVTLLQPQVNVLEFVRGGLLGNASIDNCRALVQAVMKSLAQGDADLALWEHLDERSALYLDAVQMLGLAMQGHCRKVREHWFRILAKPAAKPTVQIAAQVQQVYKKL
jgi:hypothetical protein